MDNPVTLRATGILTAVVAKGHPRFVSSDPLDFKRCYQNGGIAR